MNQIQSNLITFLHCTVFLKSLKLTSGNASVYFTMFALLFNTYNIVTCICKCISVMHSCLCLSQFVNSMVCPANRAPQGSSEVLLAH